MKIAEVEVKGVTCNSKAVKKGFIFVAIRGNRQNGSCFIKEAITNGASVVVVERKSPQIIISGKTKLLVVNNSRNFLAESSAEFYGRPSDNLRVIGITGTNGKTTISYLIEAMAKESGCSCGVIGTINHRFKGKEIPAKNTTPGPVELQQLLAKMHAQRIKYCAMEVSSHALDQERVSGINFSRAVFTNLTQDHLDYHKNLESYFLAKTKLFRALPASGVAIINNDDKYSFRIKKLTSCRLISYGINNKSTVMAKDIVFGIQETKFTLIAPGLKSRIKTHLIGRYNIYNILAAISWGISEDLHLKDIKSAIEKLRNVPGRLEKVNCKEGRNIFVDYAHTPDALFNVISALRPLIPGRMIVIFGCGGERDRLKRPKMGKIVTQLADYAIITNDNPRSEDPLCIIKDIRRGIRKDNYCVIPDRFIAIKAGLRLTKNGDCLIIAGKGHEEYQVLKNRILHFSDREVVQKCLR
ncbi:MAG: UDP-N-acetylmuramoyl-L-alanyl-D-glutamate--2,6-diaminopimelate ligase [Candidatus Omnitrophica bacterium]|nr:UDP-N-acetylmuramoyl-L-alanyl-D-glutamate--2,6-diaminopimelate ligase [Candidatus Omnitrophota bacterium]MBU1923787.1 UDP-N-acetylmuramoyl-L-alanyl-D-glutamate--2,6-diaminopimelate ligase [Candidatus Omnitrophota bacterium]